MYSTNILGSTNIPTDTKNTAPNKSLIGFITSSIRSDSSDSERIEPIIKAPKADEKPTDVANKTIPKQSAIEVKSNNSLLSSDAIFFKNVGTK